MIAGLGLGLGLGLRSAQRLRDAVTTDFAARVASNSGTINGSSLSAVDTFVLTLKGAGLWTKLLRCNLFVGDQLAACMVPLVVGAGGAVDTNVNFVSGDYTPTTGLSGDGSTKYINTGLAITTATGGLSAYVRTNLAAQAGYIMGVSANGGADLYRMGKAAAGTFDNFWGQSSTASKTETSPAGFYHGIRRGGTENKWYRGAVEQASSSTACTPAGQPTLPLFIFARNNVTAGVFLEGGVKLAGYAVDDGTMTAGQEAAWYNAWQALQVALGRSV